MSETSTIMQKIIYTDVTASDSVLKQMNTNFSDKQDDIYVSEIDEESEDEEINQTGKKKKSWSLKED